MFRGQNSLFQNKPISDLSSWLAVATANLEPSSRLRISEEIESHYSQAVAAHLFNDESEAFAKTSALSELGDPRQAARRFQKSHLTVRESEWINRREASARNRFFRGALLALLTFNVIFVFLGGSLRTYGIACSAFLILQEVCSRWAIKKSLPQNSLRRQLSMVNLASGLAFTVMFCAFSRPDSPRSLDAVALFATYAIYICCSRAFRIWLKLRKSQPDDHLPS